MSFLAPWFVVAGIAAVALPILFHLFRRTPKGRLPFSTLMFLTPSPPRLTRRSRLENLPLLLLRGLVLVLLALAFGRPLLRELLETKEDVTAGRRVVVLVDTSASMRRGDLWTRAAREVEKLADAATPHDELALTAFDLEPRPLVTFETWNAAPIDQRAGLVRAALSELKPTWNGTRLDEALIAAAESLDAAEREQRSSDVERARRVVLISDLQTGAATAGLQRFEWPKRVDVEVIALTVPTTNAGVHALVATDEQPAEGADAVRNRVLVTNAATSGKETFTLAWKIDKPTEADRPAQAYVPPGQARVVRAPSTPPGDAAALVLSGDDEPFDNTLWVVPSTREEVRVLHLADEKADDPQTLRYFLERAFAASPGGRRFTVETVDPHAAEVRVPTNDDLAQVALVTVAGSRELPQGWRDALGPWIENGGVACAVLLDDVDASWRSVVPDELTKPGRVTVADADAKEDYALWESIDLRHPLFAPLADPRFADFSKIRFQKRRKLTLDDEAKKLVAVPVRFDAGDPAIVDVPRGKGRVFLFAAGWQPRESGLGVSSKFLPIITTMAELGWRKPPVVAQAETGKEFPEPGIHEVKAADGNGIKRVAVNLPADESKTAPLPVEAIESLGVRLAKESAPETPATVEEKKNLQVRELEARQQLWRWCLMAALGAIVAETWYAGRVSRRDEATSVEGAKS